jgi:hypothetical protein
MNLEDHKHNIMAVLKKQRIMAARKKQRNGKLEPRNEEQDWEAIKVAVINIQKDRKRYDAEARNDPTGKIRRARYEKLIQNIEVVRGNLKTICGDPRMMEPMGLAEGHIDDEEQVWVDWTLVEQGLVGAAKFLDELKDWGAHLVEFPLSAFAVRSAARLQCRG